MQHLCQSQRLTKLRKLNHQLVKLVRSLFKLKRLTKKLSTLCSKMELTLISHQEMLTHQKQRQPLPHLLKTHQSLLPQHLWSTMKKDHKNQSQRRIKLRRLNQLLVRKVKLLSKLKSHIKKLSIQCSKMELTLISNLAMWPHLRKAWSNLLLNQTLRIQILKWR